MSDEGGLDYVPEYLPEETRQRLVGLSRESEREASPVEVSEYLIQHWCETLEDGNPLYLDEDYAHSRGFGGRVAPPASVMTTLTMPFRWPWPPAGREPQRHIHYEIKELLGLPVGIISDIEVEYSAPVEVGDRISISQRLVSVSERKETRLGEGHFWTMDRLYWKQDGSLVARERMTAFGYGANEGSASSPQKVSGGWSPAVEEVLDGERTGYQPVAPAGLCWEDVREGEELPVLTMPINMTRCVYLASATRDFSPQHSNPEYARERSRTKDVFINTPFNMGMVSRFVTDWAGPEATIRRLKVGMRGNVCAGDDMIITGTVVGKRQDGEDHLADVEVVISTQDGPMTPCSVTVALPSRGNLA